MAAVVAAKPDSQADTCLYPQPYLWHPLHIACIVEQCGALLLGDVVEGQVALLVTKQEVGAPVVQLLG
jgi:hypothetical protein